MRKQLVWKCVLVVLAVIAVGTSATFAIPSDTPAEYPGQCGYQPYVSAPPYYWVGEAVSYSECINVKLPEMVAWVLSQGYTPVERYCRPAKYCA